MPSPFVGLEVEEDLRPDIGAFGFDLETRLSSVLALEAKAPPDAFSAETLGVERVGNAAVIGAEGLCLTIGYLITEAEDVILTTADGRGVPGYVLGVDSATGFGLVHALEPLGLPPLPLGDSRKLRTQERLIAAGGGGRKHALLGQLMGRGPFAGYWEYYLEDALYVAPAHPHWSGAALMNAAGELIGVGSLRVEQRTADGEVNPLNMFVPVEVLTPILADLARGKSATPPRPWLGVFAQEIGPHVVILDVSPRGPAAQAGLRRGDIVRAVGGASVTDLAGFYTQVWALGPPGVAVPVTIQRGEELVRADLRSVDRTLLLRKRRLN
ncbi:MAG: serine protease [Caulobacteraceae bacterium]|nr:serine protease [Caulobacteraceae bacterium]